MLKNPSPEKVGSQNSKKVEFDQENREKHTHKAARKEFSSLEKAYTMARNVGFCSYNGNGVQQNL